MHQAGRPSCCDLIFRGLQLETTGADAPKLVRKVRPAATLVVELPPQSFGEQAFLEPTAPEVPSEPTGDEIFRESLIRRPCPKNVAVSDANAGKLPPLPSPRNSHGRPEPHRLHDAGGG